MINIRSQFSKYGYQSVRVKDLRMNKTVDKVMEIGQRYAEGLVVVPNCRELWAAFSRHRRSTCTFFRVTTLPGNSAMDWDKKSI